MKQLIDELEGLEQKQPPAPWDCEDGDIFNEFWIATTTEDSAAAFLCTLRNNFPTILAALKAADELAEAAKELLDYPSLDDLGHLFAALQSYNAIREDN